jgi:hypothetical protein
VGAPRAAARAGMSFRSIVGAAVAALLLCGVSLAAPTAGGAGGEMHGAGSNDAAGLEDELRVGAAELAEVAAVGATRLTPHSSRAATAAPTILLNRMPARAAALGHPHPPHTALCPLEAPIDTRRGRKCPKNEPAGGSRARGSRLATTAPAPKLSRGTL